MTTSIPSVFMTAFITLTTRIVSVSMTSTEDVTHASFEGSLAVRIQTTETVKDDSLPVSVVIELVILSLLWVLALLGNTLVCVVIHRSKRLQSTTNYFVVSLACIDHIFSCCVAPFLFTEILLEYWPFGAVWCKLVRMIQFWTAGITTFILVCISLDRFYTILYPLSFKITRHSAKQMIVISWITSLFTAVPNIYFFNTFKDSQTDRFQCHTFIEPTWPGILFTTVFTSLQYIIPFLFVAVVYVRIFRFIWTVGFGGKTLQRTANPVPRTKVKMVKLIMAVNLALFGLLSPFFIAQLWHCSTEQDPTQRHTSVFITVTFIFYVSASAKPGLYLCYNSNFRRGCREVFFSSTMKCYRSEMYTITNNSKFARLNHIGVVAASQTSDTSHQQTPTSRLDSPTNTFNRSTMAVKSVWPLGHNGPSTYL